MLWTSFRTGALLLAVMSLLILPGFAKDLSVEDSNWFARQIEGKYQTEPKGFLVFTIDEVGRVEGFYERDGIFGQLHGRFDGRNIQGFWVQQSGPTACASEQRGSKNWGRVALSFQNGETFAGTFGACGADPSDGLPWNGRR